MQSVYYCVLKTGTSDTTVINDSKITHQLRVVQETDASLTRDTLIPSEVSDINGIPSTRVLSGRGDSVLPNIMMNKSS